MQGNFELRAWTEGADEWGRIKSELGVEVYRALGDQAIEVPLPQRVLSVKPERSEKSEKS